MRSTLLLVIAQDRSNLGRSRVEIHLAEAACSRTLLYLRASGCRSEDEGRFSVRGRGTHSQADSIAARALDVHLPVTDTVFVPGCLRTAPVLPGQDRGVLVRRSKMD